MLHPTDFVVVVVVVGGGGGGVMFIVLYVPKLILLIYLSYKPFWGWGVFYMTHIIYLFVRIPQDNRDFVIVIVIIWLVAFREMT